EWAWNERFHVHFDVSHTSTSPVTLLVARRWPSGEKASGPRSFRPVFSAGEIGFQERVSYTWKAKSHPEIPSHLLSCEKAVICPLIDLSSRRAMRSNSRTGWPPSHVPAASILPSGEIANKGTSIPGAGISPIFCCFSQSQIPMRSYPFPFVSASTYAI